MFLFGEPSRVAADIATLRAGGATDDFFELRLYYDAGVSAPARLVGAVPPPRVAVLHSTVLAPDHGLRFALHGDGGSFVRSS